MDAPRPFDSLPDALLGRILALVRPDETRPAAALVSKRWHAAYWGEPEAWRALSLFPSHNMERYITYDGYYQRREGQEELLDEWLPAKRRLLARVAPHVRRLTIAVPEFEECLEKWTGALALDALRCCSGLEDLALAWPQEAFTAEAGKALKAHTGITRLELLGSASPLSPARPLPPARLLRSFQRLQSICLTAPSTAMAELLAPLQQLQQLTALSLHLATDHSVQHPSQAWMALLPAILPGLLSLHVQLGYQGTFDVPALRALQAAVHLTSLTIEQPHGQLAPEAADELAAALPQLRRLAALIMGLSAVTPQVLSSVTQHLSALTLLRLTSHSASLPASVGQLTVLSGLQRLCLCGAGASGQQPTPVWPAPQMYHSLQSFYWSTPTGFMIAAGGATLGSLACSDGKLSLGTIRSCESLSQLLSAATMPGCRKLSVQGARLGTSQPRLSLALAGCTQLRVMRELEVEGLEALTLDAAVLSALQRLTVERCGTVSLGPAPLAALRSLQLGHACNSISLDPAVVPQLQSLALGTCSHGASSLSIPGTAAFSALRSLRWERNTAALLPEVLQRAPCLAALSIRLPWSNDPSTAVANAHMQALASCSTTLTRLALCGNGSSHLPELPAGPYLSTLEVLELSWQLKRLPPVLAGATRLRRCDLRCNADLRIPPEDVSRILSPLQRLTELRLRSWGKSLDPPAAARLFRVLPLLRPPRSWDAGW